jgi:hypothetical protein
MFYWNNLVALNSCSKKTLSYNEPTDGFENTFRKKERVYRTISTNFQYPSSRYNRILEETVQLVYESNLDNQTLLTLQENINKWLR